MKENIKNIILKSLEELNKQLEDEKKLEITCNFKLFGNEGCLESISFVNLMFIIEDNIFEELGRNITIVSEKAFSKKYNPFRDIEKLSDFIVEMLEADS
ncbi:Carrier domain-containing protein [Candidatus Magnetomoraceae bacterium gMMP-15]